MLTLLPRRRSFEQALERAVLAAVVLAGLVAMSPNVADPDLWGHVQYGRDLLANGLPTTTTYSYVAAEQPWINHENVMEVGLALGVDYLGPLGLVVLKMVAALALLLAVLAVCRQQQAGMVTTCIILLLTANGMAYYWSLRPQLFSFVAYTAMLSLLAWCFEDWGVEEVEEGKGKGEKGNGKEARGQGPGTREGNAERGSGNAEVMGVPNQQSAIRNPQSSSLHNQQSAIPNQQSSLSYVRGRLQWMWLIPLLMAVWTNAHGGFLAGEAIFVTYLLVRSVQAYCWVGAQSIGLLKRFAMMIAATMGATFINPYGFYFHLWLFDDLRVPRPEIVEWLPPSFADPHSLPLLLLIIVFAATLLFSRRSWDMAQLVILCATFWQALEHHRHLPFFALSVAFFLPQHVESMLRKGKGKREKGKEKGIGDRGPGTREPRIATSNQQSAISDQQSTLSRFPFPHSLVLGLAAVYALLAVKLYDRASDLKVERRSFPVSALQFMADHHLRGRVLCTFNWAQYVLAALPATGSGDEAGREGLLVHVDGRCRTAYSQAMLDEHFDFLFGDQSPAERYRDPATSFSPTKALESGAPNLVLIDRGQPHSTEVMLGQTRRWVLLYQDSLSQLWGRRERYDDPHSPEFLPVDKRAMSDEPQQGHVTWPALPVRTPGPASAAK